MNGQYYLEKEFWNEAVNEFSNAKAIYEELSRIGSLEQQDLFAQRVEQLEPSLRFCRYNVSGPGSDPLDIETLSANPELQQRLEEIKLKQKSSNPQSSAATFGWKWGGKPVVAVDDLSAACSKVQSSIDALHTPQQTNQVSLNEHGTLDKVRDQAYMRALSSIEDARSQVSTKLSELASGGGGRLGEAKIELTHLQSYLQYRRLSLLLQRNEELIAAIEATGTAVQQRVHDLAHLYDQQFSTVREILMVPGEYNNRFIYLNLLYACGRDRK